MSRRSFRRNLNHSGFHHVLVPAVVFVLLFGIFGSYLLLTGHADAATTTIKGIGGKCLDNNHSKKVAYNKIQLWVCNGTGAQAWTVKSGSNTGSPIVNSNGYCLDVYHASVKLGTLVDLYPCNGTVAQQWVANATNGTIVNPHSGQCLDDKWSSTVNGNQIRVYTCNASAAQHWTFTASSATGSGSGSGTGGGSGSSGVSSTASEHIISTLYAYPTEASWQQVEHATSAVKYAIVNICAPDGSGSGCGRPADEKNPVWTPAVQALEKAGITLLYYISTNYGAVPIATVESELANAKTWYGITSPMFDTTATNNPSYYKTLYSYAVEHGATAVVYNPGTQIPQSYMFGSKVIMQVYEGTASGFGATSFPSWMKSYPASEFSATLSTGTASTVGTNVSDAVRDNIGNFYEDDEKEPPNYATLPAFWTAEVNDVANTK